MPLSKTQTDLLARHDAAARSRPVKAANRTITSDESTPADDISGAEWFRTDGYNRIAVCAVANGDVTGYAVKFREAFATEDPNDDNVGEDTAIATETEAFIDLSSLTETMAAENLEPTIYDVGGSRAVAVYIDSITGAPSPSIELIVTKWVAPG